MEAHAQSHSQGILPRRSTMRKQVLALCCSALYFCCHLWGGQSLRSTIKDPSAGIKGQITIDEVVGRKMQSDPLPKLKLYLLRVDASQPLVELQQSCRRITGDPKADPMRIFQTCDQNLRQAVALIPTLHAVATTETDRNGQYEFAAVPSSDRYRVVGIKLVEGAEPVVMVGLTEKLKAGESITLNLSANFPWTRDATQ
jgi:hypothetical protein